MTSTKWEIADAVLKRYLLGMRNFADFSILYNSICAYHAKANPLVGAIMNILSSNSARQFEYDKGLDGNVITLKSSQTVSESLDERFKPFQLTRRVDPLGAMIAGVLPSPATVSYTHLTLPTKRIV